MKIKRIGILTSGGDAPGMNSAIYGAFSHCRDNNIELYAIIGGYDGLIDNNIKKLTFDMLDGRLNRGGSIIKSSRSNRFTKPQYFKKAIDNIKANKFDALIILGGDGTTKGAIDLRDNGINVVTIPCTIDNDMNFSYSLGYDTATNNLVSAIDIITDSLSTFNYGAVIKVMGRECLDLINSTASAIHTDLVITKPNINLESFVKKVKAEHNKEHLATVVLVLEDCYDSVELAKYLQEKCKFQFRAHILGYMQRGGTPSAFDRKYGYSAGKEAVNCILNKEYGLSIGMFDNKLTKKSLEESIKN